MKNVSFLNIQKWDILCWFLNTVQSLLFTKYECFNQQQQQNLPFLFLWFSSQENFSREKCVQKPKHQEEQNFSLPTSKCVLL